MLRFRNWLLTEMPLAQGRIWVFLDNPDRGWWNDFDFDNQKKSPVPYHGFMPSDLRALQSGGLVEQLKQVFSDSPYTWYLVFYEGVQVAYPDYRRKVRQYLGEQGIQFDDQSVVYVQKQNIAETLTPWLICHNIGHALLDPAMIGSDREAYVEVENLLLGLVDEQLAAMGKAHDRSDWDTGPGKNHPTRNNPTGRAYLWWLARLMPEMASTRAAHGEDNRRPVMNWSELICDLYASSLVNGRVRFTPQATVRRRGRTIQWDKKDSASPLDTPPFYTRRGQNQTVGDCWDMWGDSDKLGHLMGPILVPQARLDEAAGRIEQTFAAALSRHRYLVNYRP